MNKHYHIPIDNTTNVPEEILFQNEILLMPQKS